MSTKTISNETAYTKIATNILLAGTMIGGFILTILTIVLGFILINQTWGVIGSLSLGLVGVVFAIGSIMRTKNKTHYR